MFFSKKVVALMAITASFAHGYQVQPPPSSNKVDRRAMLKQAGATGAAFIAIASGVVNPPPSFAVDANMSRMNTISRDMNMKQNSRQMKQILSQNSVGSGSQEKFVGRRALAQVTEWPDSQYLVPISEMEKSLDTLQRQITAGKGAEGIVTGSRMVENFSKNRNAYKSVASNYAKNIQYADPSNNRARQDQKLFNDAADETVKAMEDMRSSLKQLAMKRADKVTPDVMASLNRAQDGVKNILNNVPQGDVDQARNFARSVARADTDRYGWLEGDQMIFLAKNDKELYRNMKSNSLGYNALAKNEKDSYMNQKDKNLGYNARISNDNQGYNF